MGGGGGGAHNLQHKLMEKKSQEKANLTHVVSPSLYGTVTVSGCEVCCLTNNTEKKLHSVIVPPTAGRAKRTS